MPLSVSHAKSNTIADFTGTVTAFNSAGTTTTLLATDMVRPSDWNSAHNYTLALSASELTGVLNFQTGAGLSSSSAAGGISVGVNTLPFFEPFPLPNTNSTLSAPGIGTWYFDGPYVLGEGLGKGQINMLVSNAAGFLGGANSAATIGTVSTYQTIYNQLALYAQGTGANTSQLSTVWTGLVSLMGTWVQALATANTSSGSVTNALTLSFPAQWDSLGGVTYSSTATSGSSAFGTSTIVSSYMDSLLTNIVAFVSGARMDMVGLSTTIPPGVYWLAHMFTSSGSSTGTSGGVQTGRMFSTQSRLGLLENLVNAYKQLGKSVSNSTTNAQAFHGYLATTTSNASSIVDKNDIRGTTGRMYWNYMLSTY